MTREARSIRCPESVLGWIPWYGEHAEDGESILTPRQRGAVEAHASECSDCRAELDMIAGAPFEIDVELPDPDRVFMEITARIDAGEADAAPAGAPSPVIPIGRGRALGDEDYGKVARWLFDDSSESDAITGEAPASESNAVVQGPWARSNAWAAAAAICLLFVGGLAGALLGGGTADSGDVYELAAAGESVGSVPMIDVVFVDSASVSEISTALRGVGVEIVSGPSNLGVYRLRLSSASSEAGASSDSDAAAIAARLKANASPIVIFAEAVP